MRTPFLTPHDHAAELLPHISRLLGGLSVEGKRRIAEIAVVMREAALNHGGCEHRHLAAHFSATEIELGAELARQALDRIPAFVVEMVPAFTQGDVDKLRAFNARRPGAMFARAA